MYFKNHYFKRSYENIMPSMLITIIAILICFVPNSAFAIEFTKNPEDISYYYLGQIFGPVGNLFTTTANQLLGDIFRVFNVAILSLGSIIVMYTVGISTIQTAQEGELMGKKFGSIWVPIKAVTGLAVLLPTSSGYSLIQIFMTWVVLQGIWAANMVYGVVLDFALTGGSINQATNIVVEDAKLNPLSKDVFRSAACMAYLNLPANQALVGNQSVTAYSDPNDPSKLLVGVEGSSNFKSICGTFTSSEPMQNIVGENSDIWFDQQKQAIKEGIDASLPYAQEAITITNAKDATGSEVIAQVENSIRDTIIRTPAKKRDVAGEEDFQKTMEKARQDGWLYAGSYYFKLIKPPGSEGKIVYAPPGGTINDRDPNLGYDNPWTTIDSKVTSYLTQTDPEQSESSAKNISASGASGLFGKLTKPISGVAASVIKDMSPSEGMKDPLKSFASMGGSLITGTEVAWLVVMALAAITVGIGCMGDATLSGCSIVTGILAIVLPILIALIASLYVSGIMLALYLPLVPYLVFTFTALGWMMLVIETVVAAPIVALGITTPAQDVLGRASPAVMLITNVFLRPSLMIVGFIAAARLLVPIVNMINFGFMATITATGTATGSGLGMFGSIPIVVLYVGIMTTIVHQVFSLIYILPDKVIRWIGGHAEQSSVERAMGEAQEAAKRGGESAGEVMKQSTSAIQSAGESKAADLKARGAAGGGGGGAALSSGAAAGKGEKGETGTTGVAGTPGGGAGSALSMESTSTKTSKKSKDEE